MHGTVRARGVIALALLAGCPASAGADDTRLTTQPQPPPGVPRAVAGEGVDGELDVDGDCLYLLNDRGQRAFLLVFPQGEAGWNGTMLTWQDAVYVDGDRILSGGVGVRSLPDDVANPASCEMAPVAGAMLLTGGT